MGTEFELKFRANPNVLQAIAAGLTGDRQRFSMETTYYDNAAGQLSARHWTLRRRFENSRSVCTLKTPAPDGGRGEFELECGSIEEAIPELCKLSSLPELLSLTADGVVAVCGAKFERLAITITLPDCTVEVALDEGALFGGDRQIPLCEVEVELKSGSRNGAIAYAQALAFAYRLEQEHGSKFRRALALAKGE